ncbi:MAG TPA: MoaD/ThiS family protein [Spirochaetota bacterium]|nr:MoaD/ThiS family protein [Spirochaetota bacterium]
MNEITVTVKLFATLREGRFDIRTMNMVSGASVADVVRVLGIPEEEVSLILVNHRHHEMDHVLGNGETLALFPPVGGG